MIKNVEELVLKWLESLGLASGTVFLSNLIILVCVLSLAYVIYYAGKRIMIALVKKLVGRKKGIWHINLLRKRFFHRLAFIPALLFINPFIRTLFLAQEYVSHFIVITYNVLSVVVISAILISFLNALEHNYRSTKYARRSSIKGIIQALQTVIVIIAVIFSLSLIIGVKISVLLTALGAASAVLLLVFKDSILGLVGGIQLSINRIVLPGDWIEVPSAGADGTVMEISQISVKVKNWDNTIVTVPTYDLVARPVKNWRGMSESGVRRIKRSIYIDMNSVKFCNGDMLERFRKIQYLPDYIDGKQDEITRENEAKNIRSEMEINGRRQTNLGVFRAYLQRYLEHHPQLDSRFTLMARQLDPTANGIPLEIYVFTKTTEWLKYEAIQSDIFDHIIAATPYFDLRIFQNPSGNDYKETTNALTKSVRELNVKRKE
ncbi:MAG: mechanosensitive ion channel family protein [Prevotellaceae bacterium]|jgi:miniconductance mechanosensitive channel|nr:mechanosensitive ion channel family protein [Prevotellaceae bacterium]